MGSEIKIEVIHQEIVTPSSPTPPHHRSLSLSVFDQVEPEVYVPLLLFYPSNIRDELNIDHRSLTAERTNILKTSLSKTLTHFYPFAGKFKYNASICCNDLGVAFIQSRVNCTLSKILQKPDYGVLNQLLPAAIVSTQEVAGHLLLVQANFFECGGMAIGVKISHKVADAYTFSTFIKSWAVVALGSTDHIAVEFGVAASLCPPLDLFNSPQPVVKRANEKKCIVKRFVFEGSKIDALKSIAVSSTVPNPTRVEVVLALICKCATEASRSNSGYVRPSVWYQMVNMRKVLGQPMSVMGNLVGLFAAKTEESEASFESLVAMFRKGNEKFKLKYVNGVSGKGVCEIYNEYWKLMQRGDMDNYNCISWCRFPFYEANFGWGMPSWVCIPGVPVKNIIALFDTSDGAGIEVCMSFKEEDMALIETNQELLVYASPNPPII